MDFSLKDAKSLSLASLYKKRFSLRDAREPIQVGSVVGTSVKIPRGSNYLNGASYVREERNRGIIVTIPQRFVSVAEGGGGFAWLGPPKSENNHVCGVSKGVRSSRYTSTADIRMLKVTTP